MPIGITGMIINGIKDDGSDDRDQSPDITDGFVDGLQYSMAWDNGNKVQTNDSRVPQAPEEYSSLYIIADEAVLAGGKWIAALAKNATTGDSMWFALEYINGRIYKALVPASYGNLEIYRMECAPGVFDTTGATLLLQDTITPTDPQNTVVYYEDLSYNFINVFDMFFVNEFGWENFELYYTDEFGTHLVTPKFVEKDKNGNDVYTFYAPSNASKVIVKNDDGKSYIYTCTGDLADRTVFGKIEVEVDAVDKDITVNVGIDTSTMGNSNIVVFEWCVPAELGFTFVNTGLLLVEEEDYLENTFVKGTMDANVIQFTPAKKYQASSGAHSVTVPQVAKGDSWIVCAFIQYRDADGVLHTKYSKQVTGTK